MFKVYRQEMPIPTRELLPGQPKGGVVWHLANLIYVGKAKSMKEAKTLCVAPILEAV